MSSSGPARSGRASSRELATDLPAYWQRLVVRPGLTGLAQVRRGYETSMAEKLAHDLEWIADRSVPPLPAHARRDRLARAAPDVPQAWSGRASRLGRACAGSAGSSRPAPVDREPARAACRRRSSTAGPTRDGIFVDGAVGLAARRLAIIDLDGGDQPIANEDGTRRTSSRTARSTTTASCARELERAGHRFRTALRHRGARRTPTRSGASASPSGCAACSRSRSGTRRARRLVLARDRFGIKPLYYRDDGGELAFASELDALPRGEIDLDALEAFLAFNSIPAPLLDLPGDPQAAGRPPARLGATATLRLERFARPAPGSPRRATTTRPSWSRSCRARLRDSVRAHLVADVPVGVLLSGGVDSGVLAALAAAGERPSRCARSRSASRSARSTSSPTRARSPSATGRDHRELVAAARRRAAAARARRGLRRAVRRLVGAADVPRLAARGRGRQGRALRRGRRRALRRLLHLRRRPARAARRRRSRRSRGRWSSGCRPRRDGRASTTRRSASCARRTCRRSSATTAGRRSSPPTRAPS